MWNRIREADRATKPPHHYPPKSSPLSANHCNASAHGCVAHGLGKTGIVLRGIFGLRKCSGGRTSGEQGSSEDGIAHDNRSIVGWDLGYGVVEPKSDLEFREPPGFIVAPHLKQRILIMGNCPDNHNPGDLLPNQT